VATVHLLSAAPRDHEKAHLDLDQLRAAAAVDRIGEHRLVDDPVEAEVILFVETSWAAGYYFERVRRHPVYRSYPGRSYLFSATDKVVPFLPGVYASIEASWYWPSWTRSGVYPGVKEGGAFVFDPNRSPTKLFSFVGAGTGHEIRAHVLGLDSADAILIDSSGVQPPPVPDGDDPYTARYIESLRDSAFVICPRGGGSSSFRLFETLMMGRVPVIVSDPWVAPVGPDWVRFSLRVAESEVESIPQLLRDRSAEAGAMGKAAREAWQEWFAQDVIFQRVVDWCLELGEAKDARRGVRRYAPYLQMLRPYHAARYVAKRAGHGREAPA
jgi:hypothetical protein